MALLLSERDVGSLLTMPEAIGAVEDAFRACAAGSAVCRPRERVKMSRGVLHVMPAGWEARGYFGFKAYTSFDRARFWFWLFEAASGRLLSVMGADRLGQIRTGAASGVATKHLAREDAAVLGIIGSGWQARSQVEAICAVRDIREVRCYSRDPGKRRAFAEERRAALELNVVAVERAEEAVHGCDVVATATTSRDPVLLGQWLDRGTHVNAAGANWAHRREIDEEAVQRSDVIVTDSIEQARSESGDLIVPIEKGLLAWERVGELQAVLAGTHPGRRSPADITLFKSNGVAIEDVAAAAIVYEKARAARMGRETDVLDVLVESAAG